MGTMNAENTTGHRETDLELSVAEPAADETVTDTTPRDDSSDGAVTKARKFAGIKFSRKGFIIAGIVAAITIVTVVLILLLSGNGKIYKGPADDMTMILNVLEDGFTVKLIVVNDNISVGRDCERGVYTKRTNGSYLIDGVNVNLAPYSGDYFVVLDDKGRAVAGQIIELSDENCYWYKTAEDITYEKNADGTYRLGDEESVRLQDAGDGLYRVASDEDEEWMVMLDTQLRVFKTVARLAFTMQVAENEVRNTVYCTVDSDGIYYRSIDLMYEIWIENGVATVFEVTNSDEYIQKKRGNDRIVYLMEDDEVGEVVTINDSMLLLDGVTYKDLGGGMYYALKNGREYRVHLNGDGTYKCYEERVEDGLQGYAEFIWEPGEKLEIRVDGESWLSIIVDGKTAYYSVREKHTELTKVK